MKRIIATTCMLAATVALLAQEPVVVEPRSKRHEKPATTATTTSSTTYNTSGRNYSSYDERAKRWAVGFNIDLGTKHPVLAFGLGANLQYFATDHFRMEASYNGFLRRQDWASWDVNVNFHYLFRVIDRLEVYPLLGVAYTQARFKTSDPMGTNETLRAPGFNVGAGAQYNITDHLFAKAECYWRYVPTKELGGNNVYLDEPGELSYRAIISVGLGVRF